MSKENIFKPNYFVFFVGNIIVLFFIVSMLTIIYKEQSKDRLEIYLFCLTALFFLIKILHIFLDVWIVKINKKKVILKRPWKKKWQELDTDTFTKIELKVRYRGMQSYVDSKRLSIYTNSNKKYNFYTYSNEIKEQLYIALLSQTPNLLAEYKTRRKQEYIKQEKNRKIDTVDWIIIIIMLIYLLVLYIFDI